MDVKDEEMIVMSEESFMAYMVKYRRLASVNTSRLLEISGIAEE